MALYRSPLTVTLWPSSFLKKWGDEFTSVYCISIGKGEVIGKLRGVPGLLGIVISLIIAEDVYVYRYPLQSADSLGCSHSVYKCNYILDQLPLRIADLVESEQ
ncbi:hypothetical protein TNCV_1746821 [Trichonephila clavipes]|nr:hypothetical protein TNCV_1746821 [Trichonephila clavipes]